MLLAVAYFLLIVLGIAVAGTIISHYGGWTEPFIGSDGCERADSVASLERITLGGVKQAVLIRGKSVNNPLLLYLHGGPGAAEMHLLRHFNAKLEDAFIVANWDQRPSGRSFTPLHSRDRLTIDGLVSDARELMETLCRRFGKKKVFVLGHGWGTVLGMRLAQEIPARIAAYIGMGQIVDMREGEAISFRFALARAKENNDGKALKALEKTGGYPGGAPMFIRVMRKKRRLLYRYGGALKGDRSGRSLLRAFLGHEYTVFDLIGYGLGRRISLRGLWTELMDVHLGESAAELEVPVYFFTGRGDFCAPFELVEEYFGALEAPMKEMVWFERSAHFPNIEEPDKFLDKMIEVRDRHER
jgi:pimeloyl-ACP methyl ester carboxylesterase